MTQDFATSRRALAENVLTRVAAPLSPCITGLCSAAALQRGLGAFQVPSHDPQWFQSGASVDVSPFTLSTSLQERQPGALQAPGWGTWDGAPPCPLASLPPRGPWPNPPLPLCFFFFLKLNSNGRPPCLSAEEGALGKVHKLTGLHFADRSHCAESRCLSAPDTMPKQFRE